MNCIKDKSTMRKADSYIIGTGKTLEEDSSSMMVDVLVEVLIRLPIKYLFQFMCVSKQCRFIILQPWFREYYLKHNPFGLLLRWSDSGHPRFWYSNLREAQTLEHPQDFFNTLSIGNRIQSSSSRPISTQVINGLFCVISGNVSKSLFFLFSVRRYEIMELPEPCFRSSIFHYNFGFEPVEGVYKLLASPTLLLLYPAGCHILTLNRRNKDISSWKKLPPQDYYPQIRGKSLCVNGFLFWLNDGCLKSFDLKEEKFYQVDPPDYNSFDSTWITPFKGRLALFKRDSIVDELVLYTLDDKFGRAWTKHVALLPRELQHSVRSDSLTKLLLPIVVPVGNLPTGELLLLKATSEDSEDPFTTVYSYNHINNSFRRYVVGKLPQDLFFRQLDFYGHVADTLCCVEPNFDSPAEFFV